MAMTLEEITAATQKLPLNGNAKLPAVAYSQWVAQWNALKLRDKNLLLYGGGALALVLVLALAKR